MSKNYALICDGKEIFRSGSLTEAREMMERRSPHDAWRAGKECHITSTLTVAEMRAIIAAEAAAQ